MGVILIFYIEFKEKFDYAEVEKIFKKYFDFKLIEDRKESWALPVDQWTLLFEKEKMK